MYKMFEYKEIEPQLISDRIIYSCDDSYYKTYDSVIMSCYMTSKPDPQRQVYQQNDSYEYIKPFYETVLKCGLHAIIFTDNLSDEFIEKYQTDRIIFKKCKIGGYSINDERFILYYQYLLSNPYKYVLMTDVSDVFVNLNPFDLLKNDGRIFVGTNVVGMGCEKRTPMWFERRSWKIDPFNEKLKKARYDEIGYQPNQIQIYSAGLLGSSYQQIMWFLVQMINIMLIIKSHKNYNMIIFNYIINRHLLKGYDAKSFCTDYIFTGAPFNSLFGKFEKMEDSSCCFFHK